MYLSKSGADETYSEEGQGQGREQREQLQSIRGHVMVVQDSGAKSDPPAKTGQFYPDLNLAACV